MLFWPSQAGPVLFAGSDKVVHLGLFALLAITAAWRFGLRWPVILLLVGYAAGSELIQARFLPGRSGDAADALADTLGIALGVAVFVSAMRRRGGSPSRQR